jgi:hypothetical protein
MRNVVAVIGGFVVWSALWLGGNAGIKGSMSSRYQADGFSQDATVLVLALVLSVICSLAGGWVTGRLGSSPIKAGKILGIVLLAVGIMVQASAWNSMPVWYHLIFLAMLFPVAKMGAARGAAGRLVAGRRGA